MNFTRYYFWIIATCLISLDSAYAQNDTGAEKAIVLDKLLQTIPSPLEISSLIKDKGVAYQPELLNPGQRVGEYLSPYKQALNLGIYGTDLGYINIYKKTDSTAQAYLGTVTTVSKALKVDDQIDFVKIAQFALSNNMNGLLAQTSNSFQKINQKLIKEDKAHLSLLILTGAWIENLYLTCEVSKSSPNEVLDERIVEQKIILKEILPIFEKYKKGAQMDTLYNQLQKLDSFFDNIKIKQKSKSTDEYEILLIEGLEVIAWGGDSSKNKSKIKYKEEDLIDILMETSFIRDEMVKSK